MIDDFKKNFLKTNNNKEKIKFKNKKKDDIIEDNESECDNIDSKEIINNFIDINNISLDIEDCIEQYIDNETKLDILHKISVSNKSCFYIKLVDKIQSSIFGSVDLWITIEDYGNNIWGISDTYEYNPDFIKFKEELQNNDYDEKDNYENNQYNQLINMIK